MTFSRRQYQVDCLNKIWSDIQTNLNVLLVASTGAGKTFLVSKIIQRLLAENPSFRILFLVDIEILIQQTIDSIVRVAPELEDKIGICCDSVQKEKQLDKSITIASKQSLITRLNEFAPVQLIIPDECHMMAVPQDDWKDEDRDQYAVIIDTLRSYNPKTRLLGITATPYKLSTGYIYGDKNTKGSLPYFDQVNYKIGVHELQELGFLAPLKAKTIISDAKKAALINCKIQAGEFNLSHLAEIETSGIHLQSAVDAYKECAIDRKKTLAFCVTIDHAEKLADKFTENGIPAIAIHSDLDKVTLKESMDSLRDGGYKVFCSVTKLIKGMDVVDIDCILGVRATKSTALFIQGIGRGLRISPKTGKVDCLYLDLVGNINEHFGHTLNLDKPRVFYKLTKKSDSEKKEPEAKQCPECSAVLHPACRVCPDCEYVFVFQTTIDQQPELRDVVIGPDIRTFPVTNMTMTLNHSKKSGKDNLWIKLHFEDPEADFRSKFKSVSMWLCFPNDGYSGFAVTKCREILTQLSCGELPIHNEDGTLTYPESAKECYDNALDMFIQPETVTVDMSGKWPELKSFSYDVVEDKQEAFGGRKIPVEEFIKDYINDEEDIPF